jgi:hypothetical protein
MISACLNEYFQCLSRKICVMFPLVWSGLDAALRKQTSFDHRRSENGSESYSSAELSINQRHEVVCYSRESMT